MRSPTGILFLLVVLFTAACSTGVQPDVNSSPSNAANTAAQPQPLPEPEPGSPRYVFAHQPDFQANVKVQSDSTTLPIKVAKKGGNYRVESEIRGHTQITYTREGQSALMFFPEKKEYFEFPNDKGRLNVNLFAAQLEALVNEHGLKIEKVGNETVDGHPSTKYRIVKDTESGEMFVYTADDLKNLVIKIHVTKENKSFLVTLSDISMDVPAEAVEPPAQMLSEYKKIEQEKPLLPQSDAEEGAPPATNTAPAPQ